MVEVDSLWGVVGDDEGDFSVEGLLFAKSKARFLDGGVKAGAACLKARFLNRVDDDVVVDVDDVADC